MKLKQLPKSQFNCACAWTKHNFLIFSFHFLANETTSKNNQSQSVGGNSLKCNSFCLKCSIAQYVSNSFRHFYFCKRHHCINHFRLFCNIKGKYHGVHSSAATITRLTGTDYKSQFTGYKITSQLIGCVCSLVNK